jgi:small nuclear ribonucleoprotein G
MTYVFFGKSCISNVLTVSQVYLNIVLDDALEEKPGGEKVRIGMVVIRGNAVVMLEVRTPAHSSTWTRC